MISGQMYRCGPNNNQWLSTGAFKGATPWADATAFGAIAVQGGSIPSTTATCNGTTTITTSGPFFNGWGFTAFGCGATNTLATPGAPAVTPDLATSGTPVSPGQIDYLVSSPTGSTTYKYRIIAADQHDGITAAGGITTIANGLATLGKNTLTVSTLTRTGTTITVTTTGTQNLTAGGLVHLSNSTNAQFSGWYNVQTANNAGNSFTIANTGLDSRLGDAANATGGQVTYFVGNYVNFTPVTSGWKYYVCASRPADSGAWHLIGVTLPAETGGGQYPTNSFFDWGATLNGNQTYPPNVTDAACTSAVTTNDSLTSTVVSGGGTNTIVVANAASQSISGVNMVFDDAPAILAAANSIAWNAPSYNGGTLYIPPVPTAGGREYFIINSYLKLPNNISIKQAGALLANNTIEFGPITNIDGSWIAPGAGDFSFSGRATINCAAANPCLYSPGAGDSTYSHMTVTSGNTNGGVLWLTDEGYQVNWEDVSFDTNGDGAGDYIGIALILRSTSTGGNPYHFNHVSFSGGPNQVTDATWAPLLYIPENLLGAGGLVGSHPFLDMHGIFFNRRGVLFEGAGGNLGLWNIDWCYRQGGITPLFSIYNASGSTFGQFNMKNCLQDTETSSTLALIGSPNQLHKIYVHFDQVENSSVETGGTPPAVTGIRPWGVLYSQSDVALSDGPGSLIIDNNGAHSFNGYLTPTNFAVLTACATAGEGVTAEVNDASTSALGATITGGGANKVYARCDGTNWTVIAASGVSAGSATWNGLTPGVNSNSGTFAATGNSWDFSGASHTRPVISVATAGTLPATCTVSELAFVTGATAGQQLYECSATNTWTQQSGAGSLTKVCSQVTVAMSVAAIGSGAKSAIPSTATCTGLTSSDSVSCTAASELFSVTGFTPTTNGILNVSAWPTTNTINVEYENDTLNSITPGALTLNCSAWR